VIQDEDLALVESARSAPKQWLLTPCLSLGRLEIKERNFEFLETLIHHILAKIKEDDALWSLAGAKALSIVIP
jgi:hypothetical protein